MKRTRVSEDFNPVYPYGTESSPNVPFITPPFVSSNGLQESPPGVLALKYQDPLTVSEQGNLALKLGSGVGLSNGALTTTAPPVAAPLTTTNDGTIGLNNSPPLTVSAGSLTLAHTNPLTVTSEALSLSYSAPLTVSAGALTLASPAEPLALTSGTLTLTQTPPLTVTSGALGLSHTSPLAVTNGSLGLSTTAPLQVSSNALALSTTAPLNVTSDSLALSLGNGLGVSNSQLVVKATGGVGFDSLGSLKINAAGGMRVDNSNTLILHVAYPFDASNQLTLRIGAGLVITDTKLQLKTGPGLITNANNQVQVSVDTSQGLKYATTGSSISVKLGSGLKFDNNGNIALSTATARAMSLPLTSSLWSHPMRLNCSIYEPLDSQLALCLSKSGSHVLGTVALKPVSGQAATSMPDDSLTIHLYFNEHGALLPQSALDPTAWGYREDNAVSTEAVTEALDFMPSALVYPRASDPPSFSAQFLPASPPATFSVTYNAAPVGFSLTFAWSATPRQPFSAPQASFCYVSEQ